MNIDITGLISDLKRNKFNRKTTFEKMKFTAKPRIDAPIANAATLLAFAKQYPAAL
jgi:hypothetical protein